MKRKIISYKPIKAILHYTPIFILVGFLFFILTETLIEVTTTTLFRLIFTPSISLFLGIFFSLFPLMSARQLGIRNHINVLSIDSSKNLFIDRFRIDLNNIKRISSRHVRYQTLYTIELKEMPNDLLESLGYNRKTIIFGNKNILYEDYSTLKALVDIGVPKDVFIDTPMKFRDFMGWPEMLD